MIAAIVIEIFALRGESDALSAKEMLLKGVIVSGSLASIAKGIVKRGSPLNFKCVKHL